MENKKNFYAEYNEYYKTIEKKELNVKIVPTLKRSLPFPFVPFTDEVDDELLKDMLLSISNNEELFLIATKKFDDSLENGKYNKVGAVCKIEYVNVKDKGLSYICNVLYFANIVSVETENNVEVAHVVPMEITNLNTENTKLLLEKAKALFYNYINYSNRKINLDLLNYIRSNSDPNVVVSLITATSDFTTKEQYSIMQEPNMELKLENLIVLINKLFSLEAINKRIDDKIRKENEKRQKELYIKEKIKYLNEEIGEKNEFDELEQKIKSCGMPKKTEEYVLTQLTKLTKTPTMAADYNVLKNYLDTVVELPWNVSTVDNNDIKHAKEILDKEHYGLKKVKTRILEYLAVLNLNNKVSGQILCLVGAPGVGKTSIAQSVAHALGRKFVKLTLGGVHDESEIRGHRKTYVGAMVGKIIHNIKLAGSNNPVFLLDEIDKITTDIHGDPASALLEVLDPQQNNAFRDNFLEVPFDLSKVIFIATANYVNQIPAPLKDRMEIINVDSYTAYEKLQIAKNYLLPRELNNNGLKDGSLTLSDEVVLSLINDYTYEAGVRNLERLIAKICRQLAYKLVENPNYSLPWEVTKSMLPNILDEAPVTSHGVRKHPEVGVGYGLGWSPYGGSVLTLEGISIAGKGNLVITGNLKNVMKESCQIAHTVAKKYATKNSSKQIDFNKIDLHINACEGGIEKDGPSAGTVLALVIYSVLTNKKISNKFAMTGEISLTGQIYAIGGLREKLYACVQNNIENVIVPLENKKDVKFIPKEITEKLNIHYVSNFGEVINLTIDGEKNEDNKK